MTQLSCYHAIDKLNELITYCMAKLVGRYMQLLSAYVRAVQSETINCKPTLYKDININSMHCQSQIPV